MPLKLKSASAKLLKTRVKREGGEKGKIAAMFLQCQARTGMVQSRQKDQRRK